MWKPFAAGVATGLLLEGLFSRAKIGFDHAVRASEEKAVAGELLMVADELSRFRATRGSYPVACDWWSLNKELGTPSKFGSEFEKGLYYCSSGSSYVMLYRPFGVEVWADGMGGAYAMADGNWVAWPPDLPKKSRRTAP